MKPGTPRRPRTAIIASVITLSLCTALSLAQQPTPVTTQAAAVKSPTLLMQYENATMEQILTDLSRTFGWIVVKNVVLPQRVTIRVPVAVTADEAFELLNAALLPQGYYALQVLTSDGPAAKTILRIAPLPERKGHIPVFDGIDPSKVRMSDELITQIIPLRYTTASELRTAVTPLLGTDADVTVKDNALEITDTSAHIHDAVAAAVALENLN